MTESLKEGDLSRLLQHLGYTPLRVDVEDLLERNELKEEEVDFERFVHLVQDFSHTDGFPREDESLLKPLKRRDL